MPIKEALNGPVKIATIFGEHLEWKRFRSLIGLLSIGIAFINMLPIPALDGGQVLLAAIGGIRYPIQTGDTGKDTSYRLFIADSNCCICVLQ